MIECPCVTVYLVPFSLFTSWVTALLIWLTLACMSSCRHYMFASLNDNIFGKSRRPKNPFLCYFLTNTVFLRCIHDDTNSFKFLWISLTIHYYFLIYVCILKIIISTSFNIIIFIFMFKNISSMYLKFLILIY